MEKPRAIIHHKMTDYHDEAGVFVIGRLVLPVSVVSTVFAIVIVLEIIWGIYQAILVDWETGWGFMPAAYTFAAFVGIWAIVGIVNMFQWLIRTTYRANRSGRY